MYIGFDLHINRDAWIFKEHEDYSYYVALGEMYLKKKWKIYEQDLKEYIVEQEMDGSKIQNDWFPTIDADIFISHSHIDEDLAYALAGWIYSTFGVTCFIDSCVWGYSLELINIMNSKLSNERSDGNGGFLYSYNSGNQVSQHVNIMLSIALQKMIDKVEAVILLNTDNSISVHSDCEMNETYSPWIYSELMYTQFIRKKPLIAYRNYLRKFYESDSIAMSESMQYAMNFTISYNVSLKHLRKLNEVGLWKWRDEFSENKAAYEYPLDALYEYICPEELDNTQRLFSALSSKEILCIKKYYLDKDMRIDNQQEYEQVLQRIMNRMITPCQNCDRIIVGEVLNE